MAIDAIGSVGSNANAPSSATIGQDDFLRILLTQLRFQDPLKPVDNQEFVAQLAQFTALEVNRQQSEKIDTLLTIQAADQALGLLGRRVRARNANDPVTTVSFQTGEPLLTLGTSNFNTNVKLSEIETVNNSP